MAKGVPIYKLTRPDKPLAASTPVLLVRLNEMLEWASAVHDPTCVEELHNMRIAAKRLRYTMELFMPTLGRGSRKLLKTVEDIQEQIGTIHDCDVLIPLLQQTLEKEMEKEHKQALKRGAGPPPFLAAEGLIALMHRKQEERERRYHDFIRFWDALPPSEFADQLTDLVGRANGGHNTSEEPLPDAP